MWSQSQNRQKTPAGDRRHARILYPRTGQAYSVVIILCSSFCSIAYLLCVCYYRARGKKHKKGKKTVDNTATSQQQLEEFVDDMLTEKNLPGLTDDVRPDVIKEVAQTLQELINRAIINALPDDKLEEISKRIEDENTSLVQIQDLVQQSGIDTEKIVTNTLIEFRRLYLAGSPGSQER